MPFGVYYYQLRNAGTKGTTMKSITKTDLNTFEQALRKAARQHSTVEVNVKNEKRGYILFGLWNADFAYETPAEFAAHQVSLVLDGADNVAAL
jgi:hypothetical protein